MDQSSEVKVVRIKGISNISRKMDIQEEVMDGRILHEGDDEGRYSFFLYTACFHGWRLYLQQTSLILSASVEWGNHLNGWDEQVRIPFQGIRIQTAKVGKAMIK